VSDLTDKAVGALMRQRPKWAGNIILAGVRGSDAHGTKLPPDHPRATDDTDTFGVSVQPEDWYLGLDGYGGQSRQSWDTAGEHYDHLIHDVRKMFSLLLKGNPNVHCWLWTDPEDRMSLSLAGHMILDNRGMFLSKRCFTALAGYATAQMHKMDRKRYQGYQGARRKAIVDELGYDVKHAAHCIRLLGMGIELANEGVMRTRRPEAEAELLMQIKAGEWNFNQVEAHSQRLWEEFRAAEPNSTLPDEPNRHDVSDLLVTVIRAAN
jgi:predicted nucleotidyltransferase